MSKQLKLMILTNAVLGLLLVVLNIASYLYGYQPGHAVQWTPLWLRFYNYEMYSYGLSDIGITIPNFTFYLFWVAMSLNLYFIIKLGKSKETN